MADKVKVISPRKSFKGFNILTFVWKNKVKLIAILIAILGTMTQQYPVLSTQLSGVIIMLEQLVKFYNKEIKN